MTLQELAARLRAARRVLLTTHQVPDGDGAGVELALLQVLEAMGQDVRPVTVGALPARLRFLPGADRLLDWNRLGSTERACLLENLDLALVVDMHAWSLLGPLGEALQSAALPTYFLDHHPLTTTNAHVVCDPAVSSAGELCWSLIKLLDRPVEPNVATCLYAAISYDTNSFKYLRGRPEVHRIAADLLASGADADAVYRHLYASQSPRTVAFLSRALCRLQQTPDGTIAWSHVPRPAGSSTDPTRDDFRDLITHLLEIDGVEVAFTLQEDEQDAYKVSLRSMGRTPVDGIARALGGGGHLFAAAAQLSGPVDRAAAEIIERIRAATPPGVDDTPDQG
ncbi:MAG: DHH family phosphoesterase [Candidatus Eisenbacteria sp.]|nr:DHH family phosphoesterase [Candidatus Eisenbacteria bacterium]